MGDEVLERYERARARYRVVRYTRWNDGCPADYYVVEYRKWLVWWEVFEVFNSEGDAMRYVEWRILKGGPSKQVVA